MTTTITIGRGEFTFSAAHSGIHDGRFECLHGHTFTVAVHLTGATDGDGMVVDFVAVKAALRRVLAPLRKRTLFAADTPEVTIERHHDQVVVTGAGKHYSLPAEDVLLLPTTSTSTEAIAAYLLDGVMKLLPPSPGLTKVELELAESPTSSARVAVSP
jgi:6-pyruvoyl-tetrahydropterin synthase